MYIYIYGLNMFLVPQVLVNFVKLVPHQNFIPI